MSIIVFVISVIVIAALLIILVIRFINVSVKAKQSELVDDSDDDKPFFFEIEKDIVLISTNEEI